MAEKVIIVGAGISGLSIARSLCDQDIEVTILEARARTGGRISSRPGEFPVTIEEGAEFIHGHQPLTNALVREADAHKELFTGMRCQVWDGRLVSGDFFSDGWEEVFDVLAKLNENITLAEFLDRYFGDEAHAGLRRKVRAFAEGYDGADVRKVSALDLRDEWMLNDDDYQYHLEGGYTRLVQWLESRVRERGGEIVLGAPVGRIHWSRGKVKLESRDGRVYEGDKVIVTAPVGVLMREGGIHFSPGLPEYKEAFQTLGFDGVIKMFAAFDAPFWEEVGRKLQDVAFIVSDAGVPTWWRPSQTNKSVLTGWLSGPRVHAGLTRDEMHERSIRALSYIFDCGVQEVRNHLKQWDMVNWLADPYTRGSYAYPTTQTVEALKVLTTPLEETVYFAGEGLYHGRAIGTVEAALESAKRCVELVLKSSPVHHT